MDTNEEMIHRWEEIKCINIIKNNTKNDYLWQLTVLQKKTNEYNLKWL